MKKILTLIASVLIISGSSAFAWIGGPWSNNSYNQANTGTYQAVMYMVNGVGLARFTDDTSAVFSQINASVIFHEGSIYIGECFGTADRTSEQGVIGMIQSAGTAGSVTGSFQCKITQEAPVMRFYGKSSGDVNPITGEPGNGSDRKCILVFSEAAADPVEPGETRIVAITVFGAQISQTIIGVAAAEG